MRHIVGPALHFRHVSLGRKPACSRCRGRSQFPKADFR
jgi:hypothetical protein